MLCANYSSGSSWAFSKKMPDASQPEIGDIAPIYRCMTKGVRGAPEQFEYGLKWITSRRGFLKVFRDRLECGDWNIPFSAIDEAELFQTRSGIIPCFILKVRTADNTFQFGLNGNKFWKSDLPFEVKRTKGRLKYSAFSICLRIALISGLVWYVFFRDR